MVECQRSVQSGGMWNQVKQKEKEVPEFIEDYMYSADEENMEKKILDLWFGRKYSNATIFVEHWYKSKQKFFKVYCDGSGDRHA